MPQVSTSWMSALSLRASLRWIALFMHRLPLLMQPQFLPHSVFLARHAHSVMKASFSRLQATHVGLRHGSKRRYRLLANKTLF